MLTVLFVNKKGYIYGQHINNDARAKRRDTSIVTYEIKEHIECLFLCF